MVWNMNISYDYYRVFYYTAKFQSVTKAAEFLMSNQPNVSRVIKSLEHSLGCELFMRSHKGVKLTPEGEALFAHVRIAVEHIETGEQEVRQMRSIQTGVVSIAVSEVALRCLLLPVLKQFRSTYPKIQIRISNHSTPQALEALENGFADLAVVTTPSTHSSKTEVIRLRDVQECAVCGQAFLEQISSPLSFSDLCHFPLIALNSQTATRRFYEDLFASYDLELCPDLEAATSDQILPMVRSNLGIGFVPSDFLDDSAESSGVNRLPLKDPIPVRSIFLAKNRDFPLNLAAKELEQMILQSAG